MDKCDCEKNQTKKDWIPNNDVGDEFLKEENFNIIKKIQKGLLYYGFNQNAIFNKKLEENQINDLNLNEVNIDYSYLKDRDLVDETMMEGEDLVDETMMEGEDLVDETMMERRRFGR